MTRSTMIVLGLIACAGTALAAPFDEVEPNDSKTTATPVVGMASGDTINGTTTGTSTSTSTTTVVATSADYFRIKTAAAPLGIYRHRLALASTTSGHTVTLRGLSQSAGTIGTADTTVQTGSSITNPGRAVVWYGFGKQEEIFYRATGSGSTSAAYTATLLDIPVIPAISGIPVQTGNIDIRTAGVGTFAGVDTDFWLYDANYNAVPTAGNDDEFNSSSATGKMIRNLPPGTYTLAVGQWQFANNQPAAIDDDFRNGFVLDFPNAIVDNVVNPSGATGTGTCNVLINDGVNPVVTIPLTFAANTIGDVQFAQFTVIAASGATGIGSATPNPVGQGASTVLSIAVTPAPTSSLANITQVTADVSSLTGNLAPDNVILLRDGVTANWLSSSISLPGALPVGVKNIPFTITDSITGPSSGSFSVTVIVPPPANDNCASATTVSAGSPAATGNNSLATTGPGETPACQTNSNKGVWFSFTAGLAGSYLFNTEGSAQSDTILALYDSCGGALLACDDDSGTGNLSSLSANLTDGQNVKVMLSSFGSAPTGGGYTLNIVAPTPTSPTGVGTATAASINNGSAQDVTLRVTVTPGQVPQSTGTVVSVATGALGLGTINLSDDGVAPDLTANDNIFTGTMSVPALRPAASYPLAFNILDAQTRTGNGIIAFAVTDAIGGCCLSNGTECAVISAIACNTQGGVFAGAGTTCTIPATYTLTTTGDAFEDIAATGTTLVPTTGNLDDGFQSVPLGFTTSVYGAPYTTAFISTNGFLSFDAGSTANLNSAIPSLATPNAAIYGLWDDLDARTQGSITYQTLGTPGVDARFIAQWTNVPQFITVGSNTFQIVLFENGNVQFRYGTIDIENATGDYTIGIENQAGTAAVSVAGASLATGNRALTFTAVAARPTCAPAACLADLAGGPNGGPDGIVDGNDFVAFINAFGASDPLADVAGGPNGGPDGIVDGNDFVAFINAFGAGC